MPQVAESFSRIIGRPVKYNRTRLETIRNPDSRVMFEWFLKDGYRADLKELNRMRPELMNFQDWLNKSDWKLMKAKGRSLTTD